MTGCKRHLYYTCIDLTFLFDLYECILLHNNMRPLSSLFLDQLLCSSLAIGVGDMGACPSGTGPGRAGSSSFLPNCALLPCLYLQRCHRFGEGDGGEGCQNTSLSRALFSLKPTLFVLLGGLYS